MFMVLLIFAIFLLIVLAQTLRYPDWQPDPGPLPCRIPRILVLEGVKQPEEIIGVREQKKRKILGFTPRVRAPSHAPMALTHNASRTHINSVEYHGTMVSQGTGEGIAMQALRMHDLNYTSIVKYIPADTGSKYGDLPESIQMDINRLLTLYQTGGAYVNVFLTAPIDKYFFGFHDFMILMKPDGTIDTRLMAASKKNPNLLVLVEALATADTYTIPQENQIDPGQIFEIKTGL